VSVRAERAAVALRLRAEGKLLREIAAAMGVSRAYASELVDDPEGVKVRARKASYSGVCIDCGEPTDGSNGPSQASLRCKDCAAIHDHSERLWTADRVVAAIQRFAQANGRPPVSTEWNSAGHGDYPYTSEVLRECGSWANAIEAAGFPRPFRGNKVLPYGQGAHNMARSYMVLHRHGNGGWHEVGIVEAWKPDNAVEDAATEAGEYVAVLATAFMPVEVAPVQALKVKRPAA
jgi:hypothetical protein